MEKYKSKPYEIEAIIWNGNNLREILKFCKNQAQWYNESIRDPEGCLVIKNSTGNMEASVGDYIVKEMICGEFYPCNPEAFLKKYELISKSCDLPLEEKEEDIGL